MVVAIRSCCYGEIPFYFIKHKVSFDIFNAK